MIDRRRISLTSPKHISQRRRLLVRRLVVGGISLLIIFICVVWNSHLSLFRIQGIQVEGNTVTPTSDIQTLITSEVTGKYGGMFPKDSIFLYPKQKILSNVQNTWKRIDTISLSIENFWSRESQLIVKVTERQPQYLWCGWTVAVSTDCNFMDESGYVFSTAPQYSGATYLKFYGGTSLQATSTESVIGQTLIEENTLQEIMIFISALKGLDFISAKFVVEAVALQPKTGQIDIVLKEGGRIIFLQGQNVDQLLENLHQVLDTNHLTATTIQYIDLRFVNKAYYKTR